MRSKLFVPASRPDFLGKALSGAADALSFDLEDSVPEDLKDEARLRLSQFLRSDLVRACAKTLIVRVNAYGSAHFEADLAALAGARVDMINLPKAECPRLVGSAADTIGNAAFNAPLLVTIETPKALACAAQVASSHPAVAGLQVGLNDLFDPLRIARTNRGAVDATLWQVRMAAAQAGVFAYDGAWPDLDDVDGFRREAEVAAGLGYLGKSCIHPRQVDAANQIFDRRDELAQARRIVEAARAAQAQGQGAFLLDGRMVDRPAIDQAAAILAAAEKNDRD